MNPGTGTDTSTPDPLSQRIAAYIAALMTEWPPLDEDQRDRIAALLVPANYVTPGQRRTTHRGTKRRRRT
jgi:hypothetical protein